MNLVTASQSDSSSSSSQSLSQDQLLEQAKAALEAKDIRRAESLLSRALERDPNRRYQTAGELGHALEEHARRRGSSVSRRGILAALEGVPLEGLDAARAGSSWSSPSRSGAPTPSTSGTRATSEDSDPLMPVALGAPSAPTSRNGDAILLIVGGTLLLLSTIALWWFALS